MCIYLYAYIYIYIYIYMYIYPAEARVNWSSRYHFITGWPRPIGCLKLQVIFRKRATNDRVFCGK